jgi:hypothetical protein
VEELRIDQVQWLSWYHFGRDKLIPDDMPEWFDRRKDYRRKLREKLVKLVGQLEREMPGLLDFKVPDVTPVNNDKFTTINATQPGNFSITINLNR